MKLSRVYFAFLLITLCANTGCVRRHRVGPALGTQTSGELDGRANYDFFAMQRFASNINKLESMLAKNELLFERRAEDDLNAQERAKVWEMFSGVLEYTLALEQIHLYHKDFWSIDAERDAHRHVRHFVVGYAAYLRMISLGLNFIERTQGKAQFETLLDEGSPEFGVPRNAFAHLKLSVVHVGEIGRLFAYKAYFDHIEDDALARIQNDVVLDGSAKMIRQSAPYVEKTFRDKGDRMLVRNGLDILKDTLHRVWLPLQKDVALSMGHTRFTDKKRALITKTQVKEATRVLKPGDIVVERRNWFLSNVGIPGFWPHAALYLGTPEELMKAFNDNPLVLKHYDGSFSQFLAVHYPKAWAKYTGGDASGDHRLIEAIEPGVVFTSAEKSLSADYVGALRPKLSPLAKAIAIERAFSFAFRPYDYNFDWYSDRSLVCSELVYKAYEASDASPGLSFELGSTLGRMTLSPNSIVGQWANGKNRHQFNFVLFIDGREETKSAGFADEMAFTKTYLRPKWDIAQR